jgi:hypothetical protein
MGHSNQQRAEAITHDLESRKWRKAHRANRIANAATDDSANDEENIFLKPATHTEWLVEESKKRDQTNYCADGRTSPNTDARPATRAAIVTSLR